MAFSALTDGRERAHRSCEEQQDTGFNSWDFAGMSGMGKAAATALGSSYPYRRYGIVRSSSKRCAPPRFGAESRGSTECRQPRTVVRCIARYQGRVLLCQRADEPRRGLWNTPGGFLESGETLRAAVIRETLEESGVVVNALELGFIHVFRQLGERVVTFLAQIQEPSVTPGKESLDARLFKIEAMPWGQLAFPTDSDALRRTVRPSPYRQHQVEIVECFWETDGRIFARRRSKELHHAR